MKLLLTLAGSTNTSIRVALIELLGRLCVLLPSNVGRHDNVRASVGNDNVARLAQR